MFQCCVRRQNGIVRFHDGRRHLIFISIHKKIDKKIFNKTKLMIKFVPGVRDKRKIAIYSFCHNRPIVVPWATRWIPIRIHLRTSEKPKSPEGRRNFRPIGGRDRKQHRQSPDRPCNDPGHSYWLHLLCPLSIDPDGTADGKYPCEPYLYWRKNK